VVTLPPHVVTAISSNTCSASGMDSPTSAKKPPPLPFSGAIADQEEEDWEGEGEAERATVPPPRRSGQPRSSDPPCPRRCEGNEARGVRRTGAGAEEGEAVSSHGRVGAGRGAQRRSCRSGARGGSGRSSPVRARSSGGSSRGPALARGHRSLGRGRAGAVDRVVVDVLEPLRDVGGDLLDAAPGRR